jgi:DNA-binding MarR family transcriptional regulator
MVTQSNQEFIGRTLQKVYKQTHNRLVHELHALGYADITPAQAEVLSCVADEASSIVALARLLGITKQAAGELVKQLESLRYVIKSVSPSDARSFTIVLDKRGKQLIRDAAQLKEAIEIEYSHLLGERKFRDVIKSLRQMSSNK